MVSWLTGTQSFQQTAIEDVQFYRQLASRMKREQSDIPQWNELEFMDKFRNYVEGVGEQCGSIDEIQLMIGGDIDELITGVESIMDGELDRLALYDRSFSIGPDPVGELNQEFEQIANSFPLSASDRNNYADQIKGLVGEDLTRLQFQAVKSLFHYYKVSVFHEVITGKYGKLQHNKDVAVQINSGLKDTLKLLENYCVQFEKMKDL